MCEFTHIQIIASCLGYNTTLTYNNLPTKRFEASNFELKPRNLKMI